MDLGIKGKKALVFGASSGLGKAIASVLVSEGVDVAITSSNIDKITAAKNEIGAKAGLVADLRKPDAASAVVREAIDALDGIDILVMNAGGPPKGKFFELTDEQWRDQFQSLWLSVLNSVNECYPLMKKNQWGRIVLLTSISAKESIPSLTISNGLRAGLLNLVKDFSKDLAQDGITVNAVLPGYIATDRLSELGVDLAQMAQSIPAKRLGDPKEIGDLVAFLASERAAYINGQNISCDGALIKGI